MPAQPEDAVPPPASRRPKATRLTPPPAPATGPPTGAAETATVPSPTASGTASALPSMAGPLLQGPPLGWGAAHGDLPRQFADRQELAAWLRGALLVEPPADGGPRRPGRSQAVGSRPHDGETAVPSRAAASAADPLGDACADPLPPSSAPPLQASAGCGADCADAHGLSPWRGGRREAERRLALIDPLQYGRSRNHLDGAVTQLSPWIRHGVLSLVEMRDALARRLAAAGLPRAAGEKLMAELGWRDYWQRLWRRWGDGIWEDREPFCTGLPASVYAPQLPEDIATGQTGLACVDAWVAQLLQIGWLHNHARMWLASYVVHWRRIRWQAGARWFLRHLLDGDPASNNLSWQWVAGCFSSKPYMFNRANLERYGGGSHCAGCPAFARGGPDDPGGCPFAASYERLQERLFVAADPDWSAAPARPARAAAVQGSPGDGPASAEAGPDLPVVVWVHGEALGPANPALRAFPQAPAVFVFDRELLAGGTATTGGGLPAAAGSGPAGLSSPGEPPVAQPPSLQRLGFLYECLLELPVTLRHGDVVEELLAFARRHGAVRVVTSQAVDPRFARLRDRLALQLPVQVLEPEPFAPLPETLADGAPLDLRRFSRYWKRAEPLVWAAAAAAAAGPED